MGLMSMSARPARRTRGTYAKDEDIRTGESEVSSGRLLIAARPTRSLGVKDQGQQRQDNRSRSAKKKKISQHTSPPDHGQGESAADPGQADQVQKTQVQIRPAASHA